MTTIESLAAHYGKRVITSSGRHGFRMGCPAHGGEKPNCAIFESDNGRIGATCFSDGCEPSAIMQAMERDCDLEAINPKDHSFQGTYRRGAAPVDVWRIDRADGGKDFPTTGTREGIPLLIHGSSDDDLIIVVEGEKAARAVQRAGFTAASYLGGSGSVELADYSVLKDKTAAIWPDNDDPGQRAATKSAFKATAAGAAVVWILAPVEGDKADAADVPAEELPELINNLLVTSTPYRAPPEAVPGRYDWLWRDLATFTDIPAPVHLVNGLLIAGNITLWYAPSKTGKTRMLFGMLKSLAPGGPPFCGMDLPDLPALLFTEEPPNTIGERVRLYEIPASGMHIANEAAAMAMKPDDFAETVYEAYQTNGAGFGLIAIDTIGPFINCGDWNDYGQTTAAMAPIRQLARSLPGVAILLLHHQNKGGGTDWATALGSTALTASADQLVRMAKGKNGNHTITVGGRNQTDPFSFDEPMTISISNAGVSMIGTATDEAGAIIGDHLGSEPMTIKDIQESMGDEAPTTTVLRNALKVAIAGGKVEIVTEGKGSRAATYRGKES